MTDQTKTPPRQFLCKTCSSGLLQPTEWVRLDKQYWRVLVRCPECYEDDQLALDQSEVNDFSLQLERGFQCLLDAAEQLEREAFESDCETFIHAVWSNHIYPMDF